MTAILVTGGAGFIGSALVRALVAAGETVVTLDKLTYAGHRESLGAALDAPNHSFERIDVCDGPALRRVFEAHDPSAVLHLAAESHVDRSIDGPGAFIETNIVGTFTLLQEARRHCARRYGESLSGADHAHDAGGFRFLHVSTDEVFGALGSDGYFDAASAHRPSSPYAASKAAADHLVRAWHRTYGLPVITTNCTNNYGPYQYPEKLIPLCIRRALAGETVPVYGDGLNVRDWLFVDDHVAGLRAALARGRIGETYALGGRAERTNRAVVEAICDLLDGAAPRVGKAPRRALIRLVTDRPGHDRRYAMDITATEAALGWRPAEAFETGIEKTVRWYRDNLDWCARVQAGRYAGERLGLAVGET